MNPMEDNAHDHNWKECRLQVGQFKTFLEFDSTTPVRTHCLHVWIRLVMRQNLPWRPLQHNAIPFLWHIRYSSLRSYIKRSIITILLLKWAFQDQIFESTYATCRVQTECAVWSSDSNLNTHFPCYVRVGFFFSCLQWYDDRLDDNLC